MAHDVFISHSAKDKVVAEAVCVAMDGAGMRCWMAPRDILPGREWDESIVEAIEGSRVMVLIFSSHSNQSKHVTREIQTAMDEEVAILPLRIEDVPLNKSLRYCLAGLHWLDALSPPLEKHLGNLCAKAKVLLNLPPSPTPIVPSAAPRVDAMAREKGEADAALVEAQRKRQEALMPTVKLLATVDDKEVRGAKVSDGKNVWDIPVVLSLGRGGNYALKISYKASGGLEYFGELQIAATWTGERVYRIALAAKLPVTDALRKEPQTQSAKELILDLGKKVTMKMVLIPAGKFMMGSPEGEEGRFNNEGPQHEVVISKPFYMAIWEVTQEQYEQIMGKNPSKFQCKANPVEMVSWEEATEFCKKVSAKTGKTVRLPTEAEWEHACRAGSKTRFGFGDDDDLGDYAWYKNNSDSKPHTVAQKKANNWGLYDMHGNLWEWCSDWYADSYANASKSDPTGPACGSYRVLRGGCWSNSPQGCRSALRGGGSPVNRCDVSGFRVVVVGVVDVD